MHAPQTVEELAYTLARAASHERTIALCGNGTKHAMAGPRAPADESITTSQLRRVLKYEPRDLTISVEAGLPWRELTGALAANRQMVPLDPPYAEEATVGGVVASNSCGPRRRLYGAVRDLVIGMQFATLEGKIVHSGGTVVKNVAGLDMGKLMIGSFGTLAAIAVVNFKLAPAPDVERSFLLPFGSAAAAGAARNRILTGPLQPAAIDLLNPKAGATLGNPAWLLALRIGGNPAVVNRYEREFAEFPGSVAFENGRQATLWRHIEELTPTWLYRHADGAVVRASCTLKEVHSLMETFEGPAIARAGSGVCYGYFEQPGGAVEWLRMAARHGWKGVVESAPQEWKRSSDLWPGAGGDLEIMQRIKHLFDPSNLLNRGRLFGRI